MENPVRQLLRSTAAAEVAVKQLQTLAYGEDMVSILVLDRYADPTSNIKWVSIPNSSMLAIGPLATSLIATPPDDLNLIDTLKQAGFSTVEAKRFEHALNDGRVVMIVDPRPDDDLSVRQLLHDIASMSLPDEERPKNTSGKNRGVHEITTRDDDDNEETDLTNELGLDGDVGGRGQEPGEMNGNVGGGGQIH